ncbi:helix-turn-helix transcriptional regulator [Streptomyces violascens]|uniref:helix-turn-helix transcriptional regulator n=1 Tax=Streptomyces violascens TaxID=67381 RepID=UPI0027E4CD15|nr:helix-turn-helix transcriptional regulator [Streptomyces violascens]
MGRPQHRRVPLRRHSTEAPRAASCDHGSTGLSQGQLGAALGVSRQTINAIETERDAPFLPVAISLARFFEVTVEEMFHVEDNPADE